MNATESQQRLQGMRHSRVPTIILAAFVCASVGGLLVFSLSAVAAMGILAAGGVALLALFSRNQKG